MSDDIDDTLKEIKRIIAMRIIKKLNQNLLLRDKNYTNKMKDGIWYDGVDTIHFDAPHTWWVEFGRSPAPVPFQPIYDWVKRKLLVEDPDAKILANVFVKKIEKEGIPATRFIKISIDEVMREVGL